MKRKERYLKGCILGGAIGDALGWPVEFIYLDEIQDIYGLRGITNLVKNRKGLAEITDDTQMTIFTAEGILRAHSRGNQKGICHPPSVVYYAYLRWLYTQDKIQRYDKWMYNSYLLNYDELFEDRAAGRSCLTALRSGKMGSIEEPINNSKGCGGVMRVAPIGLLFNKEKAFKIGCECAAITHGHPSGYLSAGMLSCIIACIIEGMGIVEAVKYSIDIAKNFKGSEESIDIIEKAMNLVDSNLSDSDAIERIGGGWVGEEALAIATYSSIKYKDDFKEGLICSVNHDGDSDSTGAITGNILGAYIGIEGIPTSWVKCIELKDLLEKISVDLLIRYEENDEWIEKYPGY